MFLGVLPAMADPDQKISRGPIASELMALVRQFTHGETRAERREAFERLWPMMGFGRAEGAPRENAGQARRTRERSGSRS